jgi:hypothetical protein
MHEVRDMFAKGDSDARSPVARDPETEPALLAYVAACRQTEQRIHETLSPWVAGRKPIIVWGVGTHTQRLLATSCLAEADIRAFVDSNPRYQGMSMNGVPVLSPAQLGERREPILVSSFAFQGEIARQIRNDLGLENELILLYPH